MYQSTRFIADLICVWKYIYYIVMIIIIIQMPMFIVLSSWHSHCDPVHLMNVEWWQAAADPQAKPNYLGCESACRLPECTLTVAIYYYYSAQKLLLILPSHTGQKAESTWVAGFIPRWFTCLQ